MLRLLSVAGNRFELFSSSHIAALIIIPLLWILIIWVTRKKMSHKNDSFFRTSLAALLLGQYATWVGYELATGQFSLALSLPFNLCDFSMFLCIWLLLKESEALFEILYFWAIAGSLQSFVTPNIVYGFPHLEFWVFYLQHGGEILVILYFAINRRFRPTPISMAKAFGLLGVFTAAVYGFNLATNSNYMFLMADTPNPSTITKLIALIGDPPRHIIGLAIVAAVSIGVLYVPYALLDARTKRKTRWRKSPDPIGG